MKTLVLAAAVFSASLLTSTAQADEDCYEPVANWRPKSQLRQSLEAEGWQVMRIKVDDGCYEVEGISPDGKRVEATFSPSTFQNRGREYHGEDEDRAEHEHNAPAVQQDRQPPANSQGNSLIKAAPKATVQ